MVTEKNLSLLVKPDHNGKQLARKAVHFCFKETVAYTLNSKLSSSRLIFATLFSAVTSKAPNFLQVFF